MSDDESQRLQLPVEVKRTRAKRVRAGHRQHINKRLRDMKLNVDLEETGGSSQILKMLSHKRYLEEKLSVLSELDKDILDSLVEEEEIVEEIELVGDYNNDLNEMLIRVDEALVMAGRDVRRVESTTSTTVSAVERNSVKLPRLEIKTFSGEPTEFQSFYDSFQAAVHQNESLKDIEKFTYLRSLLG